MRNFLLVELSGICSLLDFFSFIIAAYFCKIPSYVPSGSVSPATQVFFSPLSVSVLKLVFFLAWSVGVSEEAREESKDKGCTLSVFCFASQRPAFQLDYHLSCFVKERGIALWGLSNTVLFFFVFYCGQPWGKILKSAVCVCITVRACFWVLPVCTEF